MFWSLNNYWSNEQFNYEHILKLYWFRLLQVLRLDQVLWPWVFIGSANWIKKNKNANKKQDNEVMPYKNYKVMVADYITVLIHQNNKWFYWLLIIQPFYSIDDLITKHAIITTGCFVTDKGEKDVCNDFMSVYQISVIWLQ